jgi:hypothetical protein
VKRNGLMMERGLEKGREGVPEQRRKRKGMPVGPNSRSLPSAVEFPSFEYPQHQRFSEDEGAGSLAEGMNQREMLQKREERFEEVWAGVSSQVWFAFALGQAGMHI